MLNADNLSLLAASVDHDLQTTIISALAAVIGSYLLYRGQIYIADRRSGPKKTQQQVAVDTMVKSFEETITQKDRLIKALEDEVIPLRQENQQLLSELRALRKVDH